jgi:hypothetical protein
MKRLIPVALVLLAIQLPATASLTPSETFQAPKRAAKVVNKIDSRLRSAFLLRDIGVPQEYRQADATGLRTQLQTHFDAVLEILEANRERSLGIALIRLEHRQGIRWTASQREYWYRYLSDRRNENLQRLTAYRDRGRFPLNEGHSREAVPIFVDDHDTACAVGHLMRESGWKREVELIKMSNLFVYATDVDSGLLVDWVLQSGLTQGEAALIQPVYAPPLAEMPLSALSTPGSGFTAPATFYNGVQERTIPNGLRFENFRYRTLENITSTPGPYRIEFPPGNYVFFDGGHKGTWQPDAPSGIGVRTDFEVVKAGHNCFCSDIEYSSSWPYANILTLAPMADTYAILEGFGAVAFSFDVVANHPSLAIDRIGSLIPGNNVVGREFEAWTFVSLPPTTVEVNSFGNPLPDLDEPDLEFVPITTQVNLPSGLLATLNIGDGIDLEDSVTFSPTERITVHSFIITGNNRFSLFGAISHEVRVVAMVPEPTGLLLLSFVSIGMALYRRGS